MRSRSENQNWLGQSQKNWGILTQAAVWVLGVIGGFLLPPPVGTSPGDEKIWLRLAQFVVTVMIGLIFLAAQKWRQKRHAKWWGAFSLGFLVLAVSAFFGYQRCMYAWTCNYDRQRVVIGSVYTAQGKKHLDENPSLSRDLLLMHAGGLTEDVWTRESINRRRLLLAAAYVLCLPLFTVSLIAIVQAMRCIASKREKSRSR
ncbi:MAG: hypothetical protein ABI651_02520 [Verrucomicrobiota bacterium]